EVVDEREEESYAEAALIEPRSGPEAEERAYEGTVIESGGEAPVVEETPPAEAAQEVAGTAPAEDATTEDWREPPVPEAAAPDMFSPFAEDDDVEPRRRSPVMTVLILV